MKRDHVANYLCVLAIMASTQEPQDRARQMAPMHAMELQPNKLVTSLKYHKQMMHFSVVE